MTLLRRPVIVADAACRRWVLIRPGPWDELVVRWLASTLDGQLAAGEPAERNRHRAIRAGLLVTPATRTELADRWQDVLDRAVRGRSATDPRVPLVRPRVLAAAADIRAMIVALRASAPVPARGVAIAGRLLTDGTGPLFNVRSSLDLQAAVRDAIGHLDPTAAVVTR